MRGERLQRGTNTEKQLPDLRESFPKTKRQNTLLHELTLPGGRLQGARKRRISWLVYANPFCSEKRQKKLLRDMKSRGGRIQGA